ncbi:RNA polymerase sigma-70 factor [Chryseolinea sp. H1M3-3]|uniref:RNA polymerase sigma-70 factor n=1 Tax=Chryseolinea sp. H1M3-3 TaxID=3034144 RepID=UPI0023EC6A00|nr:RNA polymerase sigma-70 factor [Chryseolinea sp. H1M3-3]
MQLKKVETYSDELLLKLLKNNEMAAFEEIYHRYWPKLYSMGYKRLKVREATEELVQDIFSSLWINRHTVIIQSLSSYLLSSMKYKVINFMRHEIVKKNYVTQELALHNSIDNSTEEIVLLQDLQLALEKEIDKLPSACQTVFKLSRQHHLSMKQVAGQLGISEKTVENQLGKAFKMLRANLKHFTFFCISIFFVG